MLALGDFLALTLPNFRLEDQKILVVFPPVFQLIHHLPRDGALQIGPRSVSRVGARRDHFLAGQIRNRVETEFSPHGLRGEPPLRTQPFDQRRHLTESGAILGLGFVDLVGRRASLDGVLVGGHGNAERLQYPACFVAWHGSFLLLLPSLQFRVLSFELRGIPRLKTRNQTCNFQLLEFFYPNKPVVIQSSGSVVAVNHFSKLAGGQSDSLGDTGGQHLTQEPWRKPIIFWSPSFPFIEKSFRYLNPLPDSAELARGKVPSSDLVQELCCFAIKISEALAQEFTDNQRIQHGGEVLGCSY